MKTPYKISLLIAFLTSVLELTILATNGATISLPYLAFMGLVFLILFSTVYSCIYFIAKRKDAYRSILFASIMLTAFLFTMDYLFWDNDPPNPPAARIIFESLFIGSIYVTLFFGAGSAIYFMAHKLSMWLKQVFSRRLS